MKSISEHWDEFNTLRGGVASLSERLAFYHAFIVMLTSFPLGKLGAVDQIALLAEAEDWIMKTTATFKQQ